MRMFVHFLFLLLLAPTYTLVSAALATVATEPHCPALRDGPPLFEAPPAPFITDFCNRAQALAFFAEGYGRVATDKCLACRRSDHLFYNVSFKSEPQDQSLSYDGGGLRIVMDNANGSSCDRHSQIATGHLLTKQYLEVGGRIDLHARMGYAAANKASTPTNAFEDEQGASFSCLGLYVHDTVSRYGYRNEISMCVSSADPSLLRMGVWSGTPNDKEEAKQVRVQQDLGQGFNKWSIQWGSRKVRFILNDEELWILNGVSLCAGDQASKMDTQMTRLPYEPMSVRLILRPLGTVLYHSPIHMDLSSFAYTPLPQEAADKSTPPSLEPLTGLWSSSAAVSWSCHLRSTASRWWWCWQGLLFVAVLLSQAVWSDR